MEAAGYTGYTDIGLSSRLALSTHPCFYLDTAYRPVIRRPWKIEFGCTVVFNQIIASCLVSLEYMRTHARAHACACLLRDLSLLRRASFFSHSLLHTLAFALLHPLSLFFSLTLFRSFSLALSNFFFFFFFFLLLNHLSTFL